MTVFNFRMLTLAREARGLTQSELAIKVRGLSQGNLSMIEKGLIPVSGEMILRISEALDFPKDFFYLSENKTPISDFFYRKRITMKAKDKEKLEAEINILRLIYERLLDSVEIPDARHPRLMPNKNFSPEDVALLAREFYHVQKGCVKNLIELVERNGIAVLYVSDRSGKFDGMTVYTDSNHPMIVLNKEMPNDRKRFTLAHELGHQIMHIPFRYDIDIYDKIKQNSGALEEEANRFASEFLMPAKDCISELSNLTYNKLTNIKNYWQVSKKAIVYRAHELYCIGDKQYKTLLIELSRHGERVKEKFDVEIDEPRIIKQILSAYLNELGYTKATLSRYLCVHEKDLVNVLYASGSSKLKIAV